MPRKNPRPMATKRRAKLVEKIRRAALASVTFRRPGGWPRGWVMIEESTRMTPAMYAAALQRMEP